MLARTALERWNAVSGRTDASLGQAVAACGADVVRLLGGESPELAERVEQFYVETESIIPGCADALERRDLTTFGALVERSMHNAERMLHNQVPETVFLAARARELGAVAASAFGAGFGGSVWALAHDGQMTHLMNTLRRDYEAAFPHHAPAAEFFQTPAGPAAQSLAAG
jgi:galactokinase